MDDAERDMRNAVDLLWKSSSVRARFENTGVLTRQAAADLGAVGPAARASGIDRDARRDFPAPLYSERRSCRRGRRCRRCVRARAAALARDRKFHRLYRPGARRACRRQCAVGGGTARPECRHCLDCRGLAGRNRSPGGHRSRRGGLLGTRSSTRRSATGLRLATAMRGQAIMDFPLCNKSFNLSYCGHDL